MDSVGHLRSQLIGRCGFSCHFFGTRPFLCCQDPALLSMQKDVRIATVRSTGRPRDRSHGDLSCPSVVGPSGQLAAPSGPPGPVRALESGSGLSACPHRQARRCPAAVSASANPPRCAIALPTPRGRQGSDSRAVGQRTCRRSPPARVSCHAGCCHVYHVGSGRSHAAAAGWAPVCRLTRATTSARSVSLLKQAPALEPPYLHMVKGVRSIQPGVARHGAGDISANNMATSPRIAATP